MIEKRREPRVQADFAVEVSGRSASGQLFSQTAHVADISNSGALLRGIEHEPRCGDVIQVRFGDKAARFRVIWTLASGSPQRVVKVAVHLLEGQTYPWPDEIQRRLCPPSA